MFGLKTPVTMMLLTVLRLGEEQPHQIRMFFDLRSGRSQDDRPRRHHGDIVRKAQPKPYVLFDHQNRGARLVHRSRSVVRLPRRMTRRFPLFRPATALVSVMIAETSDTVWALNERARLGRVNTGQVSATGAVDLYDDTQASRGDLVITRKNDRNLTAGRGG